MHTGFDFAFPRTKIAHPEKIHAIIEKFPSLKLVTTHLGAWQQWKNERFLLGKKIYMEISCALEYLDVDAAKKIISSHPQEYVLFGTDSPWTEQHETISLLRRLQLGEEKEELIFRENAVKLLSRSDLFQQAGMRAEKALRQLLSETFDIRQSYAIHVKLFDICKKPNPAL